MKQFDITSDSSLSDISADDQLTETHLEYQHEVLKYITEIGASLRLDMDTDTLFKRVSEAVCKALHFRYSALYLSNNAGYFHVSATSGVTATEETYLRERPIPDTIVAQLINEEYRVSESYFIAAEAPIWKNSYVNSFFVVGPDYGITILKDDQPIPPGSQWQPEDMLVVPLISGDNKLLGFLTPDAPLDGFRPTVETMTLLELFANQAAVVIEGARIYEEARRNSEERGALIEIGRALSTPDALRDLESVYRTIYEQVKRVMPAEAFFVTRYYEAADKLMIDYLIDEGIEYSPIEYVQFPESMKKLLFEEKLGYIFSTQAEYADFIQLELPEIEDDMFGNMKPSQSLLFVPIHYGDEPLGLLSAQSYQTQAYNRRHMEMLREISVQAGIAIANARLNTNLRDALLQAQKSEQLKNHFLMTASHELRTPLTAIQGYLELLGTFNSVLDIEIKQRFLNNARRACEELILLLGNVMDTSRIDQDRVALNLSEVQVAKAVNMILEILEPTIARENREVNVDIVDDLYIWVDDLRLRQVLLNLVGNALKYTPESSPIAVIAACVEATELNTRLRSAKQEVFEVDASEFVVLMIKDWGPGIDEVDQARLFTKFMRLESALNSVQRGAGLGLYLCRQLIEAMDGRIWVESKGISGEGSVFAIALPRYTRETSSSRTR